MKRKMQKESCVVSGMLGKVLWQDTEPVEKQVWIEEGTEVDL